MYINVVVTTHAFSFSLKLKCRREHCDTFPLNVNKQLAPHLNLGVSNRSGQKSAHSTDVQVNSSFPNAGV